MSAERSALIGAPATPATAQLPPWDDPAAWTTVQLVGLVKQPDGTFSGTMMWGQQRYHLRGWQRAPDGTLRAEAQPYRDPAWEAWMERMRQTRAAG